jgi:predicted dehydrogenase
MREDHGIDNAYADYVEMFAAEELDIVSVCTSNDMHHAVTMAAIQQGIDVYCEKPLAMTHTEAKEMYESAKAQGLKTGVNFSHRRTPAAQLAREIVASGALGRIHYVSAIYAAGSTDYASHPGTWRNDASKAGFGGLGDMGAHIIDMMRWWMDADITGVAAKLETIVPERIARDTGRPMSVTTEDQGTLLLSYSNGAMGYLCGAYTFTGRGYDQRAELYGSDGGLMYDQQRPFELQVHLPPEHLQRYTVIREGGVRDTPYATILVPERHHGLVAGQTGRRTVLMDYVDAYRARGPFAFAPSFREGMKVQEVLEAVRRADRARCWISLPL